MSLARELLSRKGAADKVCSDGVIVVGGGEKLKVNGEEVSVEVASVKFREFDVEAKANDSMKKVYGEALKALGVKLIMDAEVEGRYYNKAVLGGVSVVRQNKYRPVGMAEYGELVEALGLVEFKSLMSEDAGIDFESIEDMRDFMAECERAGVKCAGKVREKVVPRSSFGERKVQLIKALDVDKAELLNAIGMDASFSVMASKERAK